MYVGFFASNLVLGGQSLSTMSSHISTNEGIVIVGVVSVTATIFGYDLIHAYTRVTTRVLGGLHRGRPGRHGPARAGSAGDAA
jgi:nucleobase:cation symporter-1, NCS1 family